MLEPRSSAEGLQPDTVDRHGKSRVLQFSSAGGVSSGKGTPKSWNGLVSGAKIQTMTVPTATAALTRTPAPASALTQLREPWCAACRSANRPATMAIPVATSTGPCCHASELRPSLKNAPEKVRSSTGNPNSAAPVEMMAVRASTSARTRPASQCPLLLAGLAVPVAKGTSSLPAAFSMLSIGGEYRGRVPHARESRVVTKLTPLGCHLLGRLR